MPKSKPRVKTTKPIEAMKARLGPVVRMLPRAVNPRRPTMAELWMEIDDLRLKVDDLTKKYDNTLEAKLIAVMGDKIDNIENTIHGLRCY